MYKKTHILAQESGLWVIFRLSNVENLELINKITIFAHENGTQRKLGKRI